MGDGMVSLYMTSWEGVQDYQCQEFMPVGSDFVFNPFPLQVSARVRSV